MKYRKKPVVIEAMQFTSESAFDVYSWVEKNTLGSFEPMLVITGKNPYPASGVSIDPRDGRMIISTLEGLHWVDICDFIIRGVNGEFYPCKPNIFAKTYELADTTPDLLALLKRCKPWLEHERDYYKNKGNAFPLSATKANAKITASELDTLLSDIAKAEEGR